MPLVRATLNMRAGVHKHGDESGWRPGFACEGCPPLPAVETLAWLLNNRFGAKGGNWQAKVVA